MKIISANNANRIANNPPAVNRALRFISSEIKKAVKRGEFDLIVSTDRILKYDGVTNVALFEKKVRQLLESAGYQVKYVPNSTDQSKWVINWYDINVQ